MYRETIPITALPVWSKFNDVNFLDIHIQDLGAKGFGILTSRLLNSVQTHDIPTLLTVPHDLILSAEAIEENQKVDAHFRQLIEVAGGTSFRGNVLLFLLMQITIASEKGVGVKNPWTEYVKMLPITIPLPTLWSEEERVMLVGTSLEAAVNAKLASLLGEFEILREKTFEIPWCQKCWWQSDGLEFKDWLLLDAWYRSRCLELPNAGESMLPCIDMVNHSSEPNAYYEETSSNGVALLLRPDMQLPSGSEVTISYGTSKTEAEMLFSYGFIDERSTAQGMTLTLEPFPNDPLGKAKVVAFSGAPTIRIFDIENRLRWESPFSFFLCLNEEDGLDFKVLQQTDGSRSQLKVFWHGADVTDATENFEALIKDQELKDVFQLRVVALLQARIQEQLERLYESEDTVESLSSMTIVVTEHQTNATKLRKSETAILEKFYEALDTEKNKLLSNDIVLQYLGSMEEEEPGTEETNEEEDFS